METELPIDYATLKKQLQEMTTEMEFWKSEAKRLEAELNFTEHQLFLKTDFDPEYIDY